MHPSRRRALSLCLFAGMVPLSGCDDGRTGNFSIFPGFAEWRTAYPPSDAIPDETEQQLLLRYRPRFFLPDMGEGPISFYRDYIGQGHLVRADGSVDESVTRETLNAARLETEAVFKHRPGGAPPKMAVYARIDHAPPPVADKEPWLFLAYTLIFRSSGLPAGLSTAAGGLLGLVHDLDDWHQLDNYTAVYLALDATRRPRAITFQQHNYTRTYLLGTEERPGILPFPADGRIPVDVAIRSNELYPHRPERTRRRAVSFLDHKGAAYLMGDGRPPFLSADDITDPAREIDPPLCFLPPRDAFYTFRGWLGERRSLPGASGPPGADYNTLPPFKPLQIQLVASHWWEGDNLYLETAGGESRWAQSAESIEAYIAPLAARFASMLTEIRANLPVGSGSENPPPPVHCPEME